MQKYAKLVELENCCQTHIFLQNFVLIQPRTSPPKICKILYKKFACKIYAGDVTRVLKHTGVQSPSEFRWMQEMRLYWTPGTDVPLGVRMAVPKLAKNFGKISAKCRSFSAVSAPIFARKYAFCSIFQNLPDYLTEIFEIRQISADFATFANCLLNFLIFKPICLLKLCDCSGAIVCTSCRV